ncbi:hypothetical protein C0J52_14104 [Blattella germanica]|nr:hypothetical protein C0J52_14104 [Blattella germanica]
MNSPLLILLLSVLCGLTAAIRVPVSYDDTPSSCPGPAPSKVVLCYYDGQLSLKKLDPCLCSHLVFTSAATVHPKNYTLNLTTDVGKATRELRKRNPELHVLVSVGGDHVPTEVAEALVKSADRRAVFSSSVARMIKDEELNGLLRKEMGVEKSHRSKRDYSVFEQIDDISTTAWTPFNFKPFGSTRDVRRADLGPRTPHRPILRSARTDTDNYARELLRQSYLELEQRAPKSRLILVNVPTQPEVLVKRFDLKTLSK